MIPTGVIQVRQDLCGDCPTPCTPRPDPACACSACPIRRWGTYGACPPGSAVGVVASASVGVTPAAPMRGLGDLIAVVADPIGKALHLDPAKCGCDRRQAWLNRVVPFG